MPHIFFERLERRRSTQALLGSISTNGLSGFSSLSSLPSSGISGSSGLSGMTCYAVGPMWPDGPVGLGMPGELVGLGMPGGLGDPLGGVTIETSKLPIWKSSTQQPWLNPSYQSPSWNYLNNWTSPIQQPWLTPSSWPSNQLPTSSWTYPWIQEYPVGLRFPSGGLGGGVFGEGLGIFDYGLGGGLGINYLGGSFGGLGGGFGGGLGGYGTLYPYNQIGGTCYFIGGMSSLGGMSGLSGGISKLEKVRKNLLAFFQNKGILSDKQRQRLLSSPFDKA